MAPYAATKKNAQNSYSCTNDGSRGRREESHRDTCTCIAAWGGVERPMSKNRTGPEPLVAVPGQLCGVCSVVSYSPAPWRVQYHRRCQA